jgi:hypothetical protein
MFSEVEKVREQPAFSPSEGSKPEDILEPPQVVHITHVRNTRPLLPTLR